MNFLKYVILNQDLSVQVHSDWKMDSILYQIDYSTLYGIYFDTINVNILYERFGIP